MGISKDTIKGIIQRIGRVAKPDRIILFGSAATGKMTAESDIDLLILEKNPRKRREQSLRIREALSEIGYPVDVIVMKTEFFEESKNVIGGIAYPANKYGKVIYEAARKNKTPLH